MARKISMHVSGRAEEFLKRMQLRGYSAVEVISLGLGILQEVEETKRVARVTESSMKARIEFFYSLTGESIEDINSREGDSTASLTN